VNGPALHLSGSARIADAVLFAPLTLQIPGGRWTCLLGPSGVGKTTVLRLFAGLASGVRFDGGLGASDGQPLSGRVALMAQDDLLMPWLSVRDNVLLGARLRGERPDLPRAAAVLDQVGLRGLESRKPAQLSGGQRQRVALARTLMQDRPIFLLDEPFSALDARTRGQMQDLTAAVSVGRTVLLVTHDPSEAARLGHKIVVMTETGLTEIMPPEAESPRRVDDPGVLAVQTGLLKMLRGDADAWQHRPKG
jgi:putative hydroxymethylpyrimidine transport system ATP-binding protein